MNGHLPRLDERHSRWGHAVRAGWRGVRWALAAALVPFALWACNDHPLEQPTPKPEQQTDLLYEVNPVRKLDLVFVIDNSGSMREEQENLRNNFPDFMNELLAIKPTVPDMRIAIISTNVGAGDGFTNGMPVPTPEGCRPGGDRGIFQVKDTCGFDFAKEGRFLKIHTDRSTNFGDIGRLPQLFSCMADLGINGCGYEHQLLSLYFALDGGYKARLSPAQEPTAPENKNVVNAAEAASQDPQIQADNKNPFFIRDDAFLGIVILSDEDDCSGDPDSDLYDNQVPDQAGSLRCSLKGHVCNGQSVPAMEGFSAPLSSCTPYVRKPGEGKQHLIDVKVFSDFIKDAVKLGRKEKILVSSIIGWSDTKDYSIVRRPRMGGGTELDTGPICEAPGLGSAAPGIRLKAFTDSFDNKTTHAICQPSLKEAMAEIGRKLRGLVENTCITAPLLDTDTSDLAIDADCQVIDQIPADGRLYREQAVPSCADSGGRKPCWNLVNDVLCSGPGVRTDVDRGGEMAPPGTLQSIKCLTCGKGTKDPGCCGHPGLLCCTGAQACRDGRACQGTPGEDNALCPM